MFYVISIPNVLFYVSFQCAHPSVWPVVLPEHEHHQVALLLQQRLQHCPIHRLNFAWWAFDLALVLIWNVEIRLTGNLKGLTVNDPIKYFKLIHQVSGVADKVSIPDIWCQSLNIPWIVIHSNLILMSIAPEETKRWEELDFVLLSSELLILRWHKQDSWHFIIVDTS